MTAIIASSLGCAACNFRHGAAATDGQELFSDATTSDARKPDAPLTDAATCETIASLGVNLCPSGAPAAGIEIMVDESLDTTDGTTTPSDPSLVCAPAPGAMPSQVCILYAQSIKIDSGVTLSAHGNNVLVLISTSSIDIEGSLDVASHVGAGGQVGPGPNNGRCDGGNNANGNGGGQGGSNGTRAGNGGNEEGTNNTAGIAGAAIAPVALARGCNGSDGSGSGGSHGAGGGVVLLAAPQMTIGDAGRIDASGASGTGAGAGRHGGGGGGSGGMIVIDAAAIAVTGSGQLFANGGHGGGGSSFFNAGASGSDPTGAGSGGSAGTAGGSGGDGGAGAFGATPAAPGIDGQSNTDGGGGGGGGAGFVLVHSGTSLAGNPNVSPTATAI